MLRKHLIGALLISGLAASGLLSAQIVVDGRLVETKADGTCVSLISFSSQRYIDCLNGTVYDTATGLLWLKDAQCDALGTVGNGTDSWAGATAAAAGVSDGLDCDDDGTADLNDGSQSGDWRLPTEDHWDRMTKQASLNGCVVGNVGGPALTDDAGVNCLTLLGPSSFMTVIQTRAYWSSTALASNPSQARAMSLLDASFSNISKAIAVDPPLIWPVRTTWAHVATFPTAVEGAPVETGSGGPCLGDLGIGVERYVNCADGTVLDTVTNLLWLQDSTCVDLPGLAGGRGDWLAAMFAAAKLEDGMCGLNDGSQPGDWRLPTELEFVTTAQRALALGCTVSGAGDPPALTDTAGTGCLAAGSTPFAGLSDSSSLSFWTSESSRSDPTRALAYPLRFADFISTPLKSAFDNDWTWPVRPRGPAR